MSKKTGYSLIAALAIIFAVSFALAVVSLFLASYHASNAIGSPSSTSGLIFIFMPVYAVLAAIVGAILGLFLGFILRCFKITRVSLWILVLLGLVFSIGLAVMAGASSVASVKQHVDYNRPRVILSNNPNIMKNVLTAMPVIAENRIIPFRRRDYGLPVSWNGMEVNLSYPSCKILGVNSDDYVMIQTSMANFDYIDELQARQVKLSLSEANYLAVLAHLRVSSHRSVLLVYSPFGLLVYQEIFDTRGHDLVMGISLQDSGVETIVVDSKDGIFSYSFD